MADTSNGQPSFLGRGLLRPFRRDGRKGLAEAEGRALVQACAGQVLGTKAQTETSGGELPWRGDFGSRLHLLRYRHNTVVLQELARAYIQEALARWEPRIQVTTVTVEGTADRTRRSMILRVRFRTITSNVPTNRVTVSDEQEVLVPIAA